MNAVTEEEKIKSEVEGLSRQAFAKGKGNIGKRERTFGYSYFILPFILYIIHGLKN